MRLLLFYFLKVVNLNQKTKDGFKLSFVFQKLSRVLNGRSARRANDGGGVDVTLEILGRMMPHNGHVRVKLDLAGRLQAGEMAAMAYIAGAGSVVPVCGQYRDGSDHEHGANRE
jgi:hypothetical protein